MSSKFDPSTDLVDLTGKVAIVTGGNTGIGYWTVHRLACSGAKVYLAARNESRATEAIQKLKAQGLGPGNGEIVWLKLDLNDIQGSKSAAEEFLRKEKRLDILVNNAAWLAGAPGPAEKVTNGIPTVIVINYISPFVFTQTLLPLLTETAREPNSDVRIVNLSSMIHSYIPPSAYVKDVEDFNNEFKGSINKTEVMQYAFSKLMVILWTRCLQKQFDAMDPPVPITAIAVHPGVVNTTWHSQFPQPLRWLISTLSLSPMRGSYNSLFAAASKQVATNKNKYKGVYFQAPVGKIGKLGEAVMDDGRAQQLWDTTENFLRSINL